MDLIYRQDFCIKNFADSSGTKCDNQLSDSTEYEILQYSLEEFSRSGLFERIFPLKSNIDNYSKFIENPGIENLILWNWLKYKIEDI